MVKISHQIDLSTIIPGGGWETSVAQSESTVMYTANYWAAYSEDGGATFARLDPYAMTSDFGEQFCCDQVVIYVPAISRYVWALQTEVTSGTNTVVLALARKRDIHDTAGKAWWRYRISATGTFRRPAGFTLDHPRLSFGRSYLYFTALLVNKDGGIVGSIIARFSLGPLQPHARDTTLRGEFIVVEQAYVAPLRGTGDRGYFAALNGLSQVRVWAWDEGDGQKVRSRDVAIATIPSLNEASRTPNGDDWIGTTTGQFPKWSVRMMSGARRDSELWVGWNGARKVEENGAEILPHPHIGLAIIDAYTLQLRFQRFIWNREHAFAYPTLEVSRRGDVGMSFSWGGGRWQVQHGVGFVSDPIDLQSTTLHTARTLGGGGHFLGIQPVYPGESDFVGAGHVSLAPKPNEPTTGFSGTYFARFGRA